MTQNPNFMRFLHPSFLVASLLACFAAISIAQNAGPDYEIVKDVAYDDQDPAQKLDLYLAKSEQPTAVMVYLHGGGWRAGTKNEVPAYLLNGVKQGAFSVVSVEYRFTDVAPHPAQVHDGARAVQFIRYHAKKWNLDPTRIGATGGSAGGHLSLWLALHDDLRKPDAEDPIERRSSRLKCAVSFAGPTDWGLLSEIEHLHPAYRQLLGYEPKTPVAEMDAAAMKDVSPISLVSRDDPPVLLIHGDADTVVPLQHAERLHEAIKKAGGRSELLVVEGAGHFVGTEAAYERSFAFVRENLRPHVLKE